MNEKIPLFSHFDDSKAFNEYLSNVDEIYINIEDFNIDRFGWYDCRHT